MKKFELNIGFDEDLGRLWWDDFLGEYEHLKFYGANGFEYLVLFAEGEGEKAAFSRNELEQKGFDELEALAAIFDSDLYFHSDDKAFLIDELMSVTKKQYYRNHYNATSRWYDLERDFVARGYSQGDAVAVKLVGKVEVTKDQIEKLLWDTPIYGVLTIYESVGSESKQYLSDIEWEEVDEVLLSEYLLDSYDWDKAKFLANYERHSIGEDKEAILAFLQNELPETLL